MSKQDMSVALVTGASSGIGQATAQLLTQAGYKVYGTSRSGTPDNAQFQMLALDVNSEDSVSACVSEVIKRAGRIDLLVNNAGFGVAPAAAEESSIEQAKAIFDTNFFGAVRMIRAVLPHMRERRSGRILNIGSVLGFLPMPYGALYAATKHALAGYCESLDHELRTWGIRVSVIEPGYTKTAFDANFMEPDAKIEAFRKAREVILKRVAEVMATATEPAEVAGVVLRAAIAERPKLRYPAGKIASRLQLLRRFLPGLLDAGLRKDLRLHTIPAVSDRFRATESPSLHDDSSPSSGRSAQ
jgi:NAD(P)-dependent dehydrogenase (short-subunit alcohol dehydrogenase family)